MSKNHVKFRLNQSLLKASNTHSFARRIAARHLAVYLFICMQFCFADHSFGQSPIAYYTFDNTAADASQNKNHGVIHGNVKPVADRFGNLCGALDFDGSGYIEVPSSPSLERPISSLTITTWFKFTAVKTNYWLSVLCKGQGNTETQNNPQYRLQTQQNNTAQSSICVPGSSPGFSTVSLNTASTLCDPNFSNHAFDAFKWNFYALVFTGNEVRAYLNDQLVFQNSYIGQLEPNQSPLFIGMDSPGSEEYLEASLDDLRIFDQALDANQILKFFREYRTAGPAAKEYSVTRPGNKTLELKPGETTAAAHFLPPRIKNYGCAEISIEQVNGPFPDSYVPEGRYMITYQINSTSGRRENISFWITVKPQPQMAGRDSAPPPRPPDPPPFPGPYRPTDLDTRIKKEHQVLAVSSEKLEIRMYDNAQFDQDTITLFLNNEPVLVKQEVTPNGHSIWITIDPTRDNLLLMYAENLGKIPPNTALLVIVDGKQRHEIRMASTLTQNGTIRIRKKQRTK